MAEPRCDAAGRRRAAFKVTQDTFDELMQRATGARIPVRKTNHGFACRST